MIEQELNQILNETIIQEKIPELLRIITTDQYRFVFHALQTLTKENFIKAMLYGGLQDYLLPEKSSKKIKKEKH